MDPPSPSLKRPRLQLSGNDEEEQQQQEESGRSSNKTAPTVSDNGGTSSDATRRFGALTPEQIQALPLRRKQALFETVTLENRACEDDMELLSDIVTWGEKYLHHFPGSRNGCGATGAPACPTGSSSSSSGSQVSKDSTDPVLHGHYLCARCLHPLYHSRDKWIGPCRWPSFRSPALPGDASLRLIPVGGYNKYTCEVYEVHCGKCDLFIGHQFGDGREKGDAHPEARWRH